MFAVWYIVYEFCTVLDLIDCVNKNWTGEAGLIVWTNLPGPGHIYIPLSLLISFRFVILTAVTMNTATFREGTSWGVSLFPGPKS
jgi:hypothetical protein